MASETTSQWSHDAYPTGSIEYYEKATASANAASSTIDEASRPTLYPLPFLDEIHEDFIIPFKRGDGKWLRGCKNKINDAIHNGDEQFFLKLARVIRERNRDLRNPERQSLAKGKSDYAGFLSAWWTTLPLWLMPDPTAAAYVRRFCEVPISDSAFTKTRQRWRLFQHPDHPITSFKITGEPIFSERWTHPRTWVSS